MGSCPVSVDIYGGGCSEGGLDDSCDSIIGGKFGKQLDEPFESEYDSIIGGRSESSEGGSSSISDERSKSICVPQCGQNTP
jgi:hypothetical protein